MKAVFITGGHGFISRNLSEALERLGYRILVPSSSELNLLDEEAVDAFMCRQSVDVIVHAANKGGGRDAMEMRGNVILQDRKIDRERILELVHDFDILYIFDKGLSTIHSCADYINRVFWIKFWNFDMLTEKFLSETDAFSISRITASRR